MTRRRKGGIKRGDSNPASNQLPICSPQSGTLRYVHRVTQRRKEVGKRQRWPEGEKWESKGVRQIQPVISSLSALHIREQPKRFTDLDIKEKVEEGDRHDLRWKMESQKGREQSSQ